MAQIPQTFKLKLDREMAKTWMTSVYNNIPSPAMYKRNLQDANGRNYYGCFPIDIEPIREDSTESMVTISYDGILE